MCLNDGNTNYSIEKLLKIKELNFSILLQEYLQLFFRC